MSETNEPLTTNNTRARQSTAGKLLALIAVKGTPSLEDIARHARVSKRQLEECRDGIRPLEPEAQMRLAAALLAIAPEHERKAHTLYAQAQAALRMRDDPGRSHQFYPREWFR
jgi:hypothetical protein